MRESGISLYPVSVEWEPPFTMLTTLRGAGDMQVCVLLLVLTLYYGHTIVSFLLSQACQFYLAVLCVLHCTAAHLQCSEGEACMSIWEAVPLRPLLMSLRLAALAEPTVMLSVPVSGGRGRVSHDHGVGHVAARPGPQPAAQRVRRPNRLSGRRFKWQPGAAIYAARTSDLASCLGGRIAAHRCGIARWHEGSEQRRSQTN